MEIISSTYFLRSFVHMHCKLQAVNQARLVSSLTITCFAIALLFGCNEPTTVSSPAAADNDSGISASGSILLEGNIVVIPPPSLISHVITQDALDFEPSAVSDAGHPEKWTGEVAKALNLGVLGADLSYLINHTRNAEIPTHLAAIRRLTDDLGISHEVEPELLSQIEAGLDNPSLMLGLQSVFFQNLQKYLNKNNRVDINTCILLGGWTESMFQLSSPADSIAGHPLDRLLAEQAYSSRGVRSLAESVGNESFADVQSAIADLCDALDELPTTYEFREPIHDHREGVTYLRSNSRVDCSDEQLVELHTLIRETRELILAQ